MGFYVVPYVNEQTNKQTNYYHNYPAIERNEVLIHATAWMNLKNMTLSERAQKERVAYYVIPLL